MKNKYKHIHFVDFEDKDGVHYVCYANKDRAILGGIEYYERWGQYVYMPNNSLYSRDCLLDIADFLAQLNKE